MPTPLSIKIRDRVLQGEATYAFCLWIAQFAYSESERQIDQQGKKMEALAAMTDRWESNLKACESQEQRATISKQFNQDLSMAIFSRIESDIETRHMFAQRLTEAFPNIPAEWAWATRDRFSLRLDMREIFTIVEQLFAIAISAYYQDRADDDSAESGQPLPTSEAEFQPPAVRRAKPTGFGEDAIAGVDRAIAKADAETKRQEIAQLKQRLAELGAQ